MDVLLIGGTRFLGPLLVMRLLAAGHRVTILNRGTRPDPFGAFLPRISGFVADRRSPQFAEALAGRHFDAVVDFVAYEAEDVEGTVRALRGKIGHYILISTGQVYLVREGCPRPAKETDYEGPVMDRPADPRDHDQWSYGVGKRACEDALRAAWETDRFPGTTLRIPMVNGERDYEKRVERYLFRLLDGGPILVPDGGHAPTRHVYAGEVVRAIAMILGQSDTHGEAFNLCQEETPTVREVILTIADLIGAKPRLVDVPTETIEAAGLVPRIISPFSSRWMSFLDPTKARETLAFHHTPFHQYMAQIVASFQAYPPPEAPQGYLGRDLEIQLARS